MDKCLNTDELVIISRRVCVLAQRAECLLAVGHVYVLNLCVIS